MATRRQLLEYRAKLGAAARAGEPWEDSYKRDPASFKRLLAAEQRLQVAVGEYLYELSETRLSRLINWSEVTSKLTADVTVPASDPNSKAEEQLLIRVILPSIEELMLIGIDAAQANIGIDVDVPSLTTDIMDSARKDTAKLAKGLNDTTRATLQKTIQSSISQGHDLATLTDRVKSVVNNPVRAEMIAQTETVNAYQSGYYQYAVETGAQTKEWEAKIGACLLCAPLNGTVLPLDEAYVLANGVEVQRPAAHTRCRCGLIFDYGPQ